MDSSLGMEKQPWQLQLFERSIKKQLKLEALLSQLGDLSGQECLLLTCGDNNGALNWHFREHGGNWSWGDVTEENLQEMSDLLGENVHHVAENHLPFPDNRYDCVVSIDVLEHLVDDQPFLHELGRVLRPGGRAIVTVPNGDPRLLANRIKWAARMTPDIYGHTRAGYTIEELQHAMTTAGLTPLGWSGYSRFFTEMIELAINFGYVFILSGKKDNGRLGHIAPGSSHELKTYGSAYRLYSLLFPVIRLFSHLDNLLSASSNNAVIVVARKPHRGRIE